MHQSPNAIAHDHDESSAASSRRPSGRTAAALVVLGVVLVWLVITKTLSAYLAHEDPEGALSLDSSEPTALVKLAAARLKTSEADEADATMTRNDVAVGGETYSGQKAGLAGSLSSLAAARLRSKPRADASPDKPAEAEEKAKWSPQLRQEVTQNLQTAMLSAPLNARALQILGQIAQAEGDQERARRLMTAAAQVSLREAPAVAWLLKDAYEAGRWDEALKLADTLLRTKSAAPAFVGRFLSGMAENSQASPSVKAILAGDPPWRTKALEAMYPHVTDARTPFDIFLALKDTAHPPDRDELARYLSLLVAKKLYELAYYAWLQFLPPEDLRTAGLVFNGGFERPATGYPFDWSITQTPGATAGIVARTDQTDGHALSVEFGIGRIKFQNVQQMIMLPSAHYRLKGEVKGQLTGRRGLVWRVRCADTSTVIAETPMIFGVANTWREFSAEFDVPANDCRPQVLRLELDARSASEELISGTIYFDDLSIARFMPKAAASE
ncbi:MAG: hypothetical protein KDJ17_02470 [Hyphomicrobiaceae bacterium]|nr:hypothetical protein [Hyphomicrobiaceae bacterium]